MIVDGGPILTQRCDGDAVHPSSTVAHEVPGEQRNLHFTYYEKVETSQLYVRSMSDVSPLALVFFGSEVHATASNQITVDQWIRFEASSRLAHLLVGLRKALDVLVGRKLTDPSARFEAHPVMQAVMDALAHDDGMYGGTTQQK